MEARTWQPRWRAEIDQILIDSEKNDQNVANSDRLTTEEIAAKADATRAAWAESQTGQRRGGNTHLIGRDEQRGEGAARSIRCTAPAESPAGSNPACSTFSPQPPAPYVPRNRIDPVRVLCYAGCALLLGVVWAQIVRWAL